MRWWLRGMKSVGAALSLEVLAGLSDMLELSALLSKTARSANVVVSLQGVFGGVVGGGVVGTLGVVGGLAWFALRRHLPYLSQIDLGLGVGRSGGVAGAGELAGSRGEEVVVEVKEVEEVGGGVVGGGEVGVEVIEVVVDLVGLSAVRRHRP